jgi:8-oxo-dGTP diphosphatase
MSLNLEHRNKKANDIHEGKWNGLGGKFEAGETPEECVIREIGELMDSPEGRLEWIPDENMLDPNLWESDHIFMPWIREGKFFSAKFEYEGDQMCRYNVVFNA